MFWAFMFLLMLDGTIGVVVWLGARTVLAHMRANPEAARLVSEHVIAPLLTGEQVTTEPVMKNSKETLV